MAKDIGYWQYDDDAPLECPRCSWNGTAKGHEEVFSELLEVRCPSCQSMLLIVLFPTDAETRAAAADGNAAATAELPALDARNKRRARSEQLQLDRPDQLPDLPGSTWRIDWDFEKSEGESWTVLRHQGTEIWRELAFWEGYARFATVFEILRKRYGSGLIEVKPTPNSELYLYGDRLSAPESVRRLNASLRAKD